MRSTRPINEICIISILQADTDYAFLRWTSSRRVRDRVILYRALSHTKLRGNVPDKEKFSIQVKRLAAQTGEECAIMFGRIFSSVHYK